MLVEHMERSEEGAAAMAQTRVQAVMALWIKAASSLDQRSTMSRRASR